MNTSCLRGRRNLFDRFDHEMVRNVHSLVLLTHNYIICMFIICTISRFISSNFTLRVRLFYCRLLRIGDYCSCKNKQPNSKYWCCLVESVCHLLSTVCHLLTVFCHLLSLVCHMLSVFCHLLTAFCHLLSVICYLPSVIWIVKRHLVSNAESWRNQSLGPFLFPY